MKVVGLFLLRPNGKGLGGGGGGGGKGEGGAGAGAEGTGHEATFLASATDVSSFGFFQRGAAAEFLTFTARKIAAALQPNVRNMCMDRGHHIHAFLTRDNVAAVLISSDDYPKRVAFGVVAQLAMDFVAAQGDAREWRTTMTDNAIPFPKIKETLIQAQDPSNCDKLAKIQKQLDATKEILHETILKAIERGENLDELVQRSDDLSATSKLFFTSAKKANAKCCYVM